VKLNLEIMEVNFIEDVGPNRKAQTIEIICEVCLDVHSKMESKLNALIWFS
jgi:hypothetical protein